MTDDQPPKTYDLVFILPHTHWDREWYLPFEQFRMRLVQVIDQLLSIMRDDPSFERFTLDGQSVILDDYLAIRPRQATLVRDLATQGRLAVGPWYVLPDEFLVSGEALIRNLLIGWRKAAALGRVMRVAYLPDSFGHIAQLPQILRGFGLSGAIFSRGVGDEGETLGSEFWWDALDGSRVLAVHQLRGYCNLVAPGYRVPADVVEGREPDPELAVAKVRRELELLAPYARSGVILLNNGCDHQPASPHLPRLIDHLRRGFAQVQIRWASPDDVAEGILSRHPELGVRPGELRGSRYAPLIPGVLSTRMYLKQANDAAQTLLERWAEPMATVARALGEPDPRAFLAYAWEVLLQNHPHDSICGSGVDAVHREMLPRFERVLAVAEELTARSLRAMAARIDTTSLPPGLPLVVFNPLSWSRTEAVRCAVSLPGRMARRPRIADGSGRAVPAQVLRRFRETLARERVAGEQLPHRLWWLSHEIESAWGVRFADFGLRGSTLAIEAAHPGICPPDVIERMVAAVRGRGGPVDVRVERTVVEIAFLADDVPPVGYKTFVVTTGLPGAHASPSDAVTVGGRTIQHAHLAVRVNADGSVAVRDKRTGSVARGHVLEDSGDAGDEYDYSPINERPIITARNRGRAEPVYRGPVLSTLRVHVPLRLPAGLHDNRRRRVRARVDCPVTVEVTMTAGSRRVELVTTIENRAKDHRLRALFPTGLRADAYSADTQFGVLERSLQRPVGTGWAQPPQPTAPHESWVDVSDGRLGLAVLSAGLPEHEVMPERTGLAVALTLLRCVGWLSRDDLRTRSGHAGPGYATPEAQCLGIHQFRYALVPHAGRWQDGDLVREALAFRMPMTAVPTARQAGNLSLRRSFLACDAAIVTAIKPAESGDAVLVRVYNPHADARRAVIQSSIPHAAVREVTLAEEDAGPLAPAGGRVEFDIGSFQIRTIALLRNK